MNEVLHFVSNIFMLISLVALIGIFKPFIKNTTRVHYVIVFLVSCAVGGLIKPPPTKEELQQQAVEAATEAAEQEIRDKEAAKQAVVNAKNSIRRNLAQAAKRTITSAARNPDSVSFSFVGVNEDATTVCVEYRAQNGFGGMNQEHIAFQFQLDKVKVRESAAFWNRNCTKSMYTF